MLEKLDLMALLNDTIRNSLHLRFSRFVLGPNAGGSCRQMLTVDNYR